MGIRGDLFSQSQPHIPLKPLPPALDPFPEATSPRQGNKPKSVKHRGPLIAPLCKFYFFVFGEPSFLVKQVLSDGWVPGQAGFTFLPYWGGRRGRLGTQGVQESRVGFKNKNL